MELAAQQILRAIRGSRSQLAFARRLGYRANPVANWETGRRFPTAAETLRACRLCGIDVQAAFERFVPAAAAARRVEDDVSGWLSELRGSAAIGELSERAGRSRFAISRWLAGQARPRLPDFLRLVDAMTGRTSDLVAELVPIEAVPSLEPDYRRRRAARGLAFEEPWTEAILRLLEIAPRPLSAETIVRQLDIDSALVERCLERMTASAVIAAVPSGGYIHRGELTVDTRAAPDRIRHLKAHWTEVARRRLDAPQPHDQFGYNVFAASERELDAIRAILRSAFREIRSIVATSTTPNAVALVNLQLTRLDRSGAATLVTPTALHPEQPVTPPTTPPSPAPQPAPAAPRTDRRRGPCG